MSWLLLILLLLGILITVSHGREKAITNGLVKYLEQVAHDVRQCLMLPRGPWVDAGRHNGKQTQPVVDTILQSLELPCRVCELVLVLALLAVVGPGIVFQTLISVDKQLTRGLHDRAHGRGRHKRWQHCIASRLVTR